MILRTLYSVGVVKMASGDGGWSVMVGKPDSLTSHRSNFIQKK